MTKSVRSKVKKRFRTLKRQHLEQTVGVRQMQELQLKHLKQQQGEEYRGNCLI